MTSPEPGGVEHADRKSPVADLKAPFDTGVRRDAGALGAIELAYLRGVHAGSEAAESALASLKGAVGNVAEVGLSADLPPHFEWGPDAMEHFRFGKERAVATILRALSELESLTRNSPAVAESKRREDAPSSAPGSDGGGP